VTELYNINCESQENTNLAGQRRYSRRLSRLDD